MSPRYKALIAAVAALALVLGAMAKLPRRAAPRPAAVASVPTVDLTITVDGARLTPESAAVPKGHLVRLHVTNRGAGAAELRLAGYEDRVEIHGLAGGASHELEFTADRPGEDFIWFVNDQPAGRLAVTGSHLVEGHR